MDAPVPIDRTILESSHIERASIGAVLEYGLESSEGAIVAACCLCNSSQHSHDRDQRGGADALQKSAPL